MTSAFADLKDSASAEGEKAAQGVRQALEEAARDMRTGFQEAQASFGDSFSALREMAGSIRGELDATRAELAKGVLELPRETQDATGEMRRVVADQIKALNELSSLVSRTGRSVDVAQPQAQRRTAEGGGRSVAAPAAPLAALAPAPTATAPVAPAPALPALPSAPRPASGSTARIEAPRPAATPRAAAPTRAGTGVGAGAGDKRGWLSDLLTRASLDDDEEVPAPDAPGPAASARRTPVAPAETGRIALDTISTDIAKMIEHRTAVDLWERYRRGEPNLFDPRIYTPQGRTTFTEIQRRYRADAEFRRSVDRYVSEFERLLGDVVKNDSDAKRTDAYLTSETGKVYTMLAHASGRFDGA